MRQEEEEEQEQQGMPSGGHQERALAYEENRVLAVVPAIAVDGLVDIADIAGEAIAHQCPKAR